MPGFTLIYKQNGIDDALAKRAARLVNSNFKVQYISKQEKLIILFKDGNNYPYEVIETGKYIVLVEGKIYGINPATDKYFIENVDTLFTESSNIFAKKLKVSLDFFHSLDGEFVIYIVDKRGEHVLVINDYLGRLPLYFFNQKRFVLSRDLALMDKLTTGLVFNESAVYQYMRLGFPLGNQTLFYDTERLAPSSFIRISNENILIQPGKINLSELENSFPVNEEPVENLYEIFKNSLKKRLETNDKVVLSLSGGLDSRAILGQAEKEKFHFELASFEYDNPIIQNDIQVVKQFSKLYQRTPSIQKINEWSPEFFDEMTLLKTGMNYLGMSFILHFLRKLAINYQMMITGDGGDKTLPYLFPLHHDKHFEKLLIKQNQFSKSKIIESFFAFKIKPFEDEIMQYLKDIPEKRNEMKYKHFLLFERGRNWLFEGEDRNRNYLWSTTPFYSPQFFKMAHSIPEKEKEKYKLFRDFTKLIDHHLNEIPNANWGFSLNEKKKMNRMIFKQKIKERLHFEKKTNPVESERKSELEDIIANLLQRGYGGQVSMITNKSVLQSLDENMLLHMLSLLKVSEFLWKPF
jgi:asparagine synthase (glutamine-hydrolysing)